MFIKSHGLLLLSSYLVYLDIQFRILKICDGRDPEWTDVKLAQVKYLLSRLARFKEVASNKFGCTSSVVLCGDFNSTPGDKVSLHCYSSYY